MTRLGQLCLKATFPKLSSFWISLGSDLLLAMSTLDWEKAMGWVFDNLTYVKASLLAFCSDLRSFSSVTMFFLVWSGGSGKKNFVYRPYLIIWHQNLAPTLPKAVSKIFFNEKRTLHTFKENVALNQNFFETNNLVKINIKLKLFHFFCPILKN